MTKTIDNEYKAPYEIKYNWDLDRELTIQDVIDIALKSKKFGTILFKHPSVLHAQEIIKYRNGAITEGIPLQELLDKKVISIYSLECYESMDLYAEITDVKGLYTDKYKSRRCNFRKETTELYNSIMKFEKESRIDTFT